MNKLILEELSRIREIMFFGEETPNYLTEQVTTTTTTAMQSDKIDYNETFTTELEDWRKKWKWNDDPKVQLLSGTDPTTATPYTSESTEIPNIVEISARGRTTYFNCNTKPSIDPKTKKPLPLGKENFSDDYALSKWAELYQSGKYNTVTTDDAQKLNMNLQQYWTEVRVNFQNDLINLARKTCNNISLLKSGGVVNDAKLDKNGKLVWNQLGTGTNNYIEPRITVTEKEAGKITYWDVIGFGYFPKSEVSSNFVTAFISKIQDEVFKNPKIVESINAGKKDLITVTLGTVRGGASNYYGGPISAEISGLTDSNIGNPTITKISGNQNFNADKRLAEKRASNVWKAIKEKLPSSADKKIRISKSVKESISGYVVETGGVDDNSEKRDWNKYPIPGQHVYIYMRIELRPVLEPDKVQSKKCLVNATISMDFGISNPNRLHGCDSATFDVFANGINIGQIDLGNMAKTLESNKTKAAEAGVKSSFTQQRPEGGPVSGSLQLTDQALVDRIVDAGVGGEVVIKIKGKDYKFYSYLPSKEQSTHSEIPWIKVTSPTGVVLYNQEPENSQSIVRCGGSSISEDNTPCPEWKVAEFNPCGKSTADGTLSTILEK
jgi:hypothetical protein